MIFNNILLLFIYLCPAFTLINGDCLPHPVEDIHIINTTLHWSVYSNELCDVTHFRINIYRGYENHERTVTETSLDVSFLQLCDLWIFAVVAVTDTMVSPENNLYSRIPMPPDADLTLKDVRVIRKDGQRLLMWEVDELFKKCTDSFRVFIIDEEIDYIQDYYINVYSFNLDFLSPCVTYEFGVRAIYEGEETVEGPLKSIEYQVEPYRQEPPQLTSADIGPTSAIITWTLDSIEKNRCPLRKLYLDGGQYFNISVDIDDQLDRVPVSVNVDYLFPNRMYLIRAASENMAGLSRASVIGFQTPDL